MDVTTPHFAEAIGNHLACRQFFGLSVKTADVALGER